MALIWLQNLKKWYLFESKKSIKAITNAFHLKSFSEFKESKTVIKRKDPYKLNISLQTQVTKVRISFI